MEVRTTRDEAARIRAPAGNLTITAEPRAPVLQIADRPDEPGDTDVVVGAIDGTGAYYFTATRGGSG